MEGQHSTRSAKQTNGCAAPGCAAPLGERISLRVREALLELLQDHTYAVDLSQDVWEFATEIGRLQRIGISNNDIRWMVGRGWLLHAHQINKSDIHRRNLQPASTLDEQSCFVLTARGVSIAEQTRSTILGEDRRAIANLDRGLNGASASARRRAIEPKWDSEFNRLYLGQVLVKEFKVPSPNQSIVLTAFDEEHWPTRIDDPLPHSSNVDPKERLRYTIKSLNKHQKTRAIRFGGDGSGEGIVWESLLG